MIKLYGVEFSSNVSKVRYCLNYLGLEYELVETSPMKGQTQTDEFRAINPVGKIPAIDVDGFTLFESSAINRYLATISKSPIYPEDLKQRARVDAWVDYATIHVGQAQGRIGFNRIIAPMVGAPVDESSIKTGLEFLNKYFPVIDRQLSTNKYIAGDAFTLADITMLAMMDPFELCDVSLDRYEHIIKWRNELKKQPFYQKCYTDFTTFAQKELASMAKV